MEIPERHSVGDLTYDLKTRFALKIIASEIMHKVVHVTDKGCEIMWREKSMQGIFFGYKKLFERMR